MSLSNKQIEIQWAEFRDGIKGSTPIDESETPEQQRKRIAMLEADRVRWVKYYFPKYAYAEFADFHIEFIERIIAHPEWWENVNWARELAKDTVTMFVILYLALTGKKRYILMIGNTVTDAGNFLELYRSQLDSNQRIKRDYGVQESLGNWTFGEFTTQKGVKFRAIGAGQSPRGTKNEEVRPDAIIFNDLDTDQDVRNPDIIQQRWDWVEKAAIGTRSISKDTLILFLGNIIAKDCCVVRAQKFADHVSLVNIRGVDGKSTWPKKNTEAHIDRVLSQKSYNAQQSEYFNNPISQGTVFKEMTYGKCPDLKDLPFVLIYADPATSNKDRPTLKAKVQNSCKSVVVLGCLNLKFYVYKAFVDSTTNSTFIDWLYAAKNYAANAAQIYTYIENNTLQDPFYEQVLLPLIFAKGEVAGDILGIIPDTRSKPDKYFRIEGTLEPLNRLGLLTLNIDEKTDPHMERLEAQFKSVSANSKTMDGPDAVEGGVFKIKEKMAEVELDDIRAVRRNRNTKTSY